jgi:NADH-quinone oxidoreductase subunit L
MRHMGGLKKDLPITYWTFLIGSLAIAGVPMLSGFFSKDEILFRTFASGHTVLWAVALATSFLTAIYMFRLVFLTFHGERHPEPGTAHLASSHRHLHDAPGPMALALIVLAIGSVAAGYVGPPVSHALDRFLEPSFTVGESAAHEAPADTQLEAVLMGVSTAVAIAGIGIAVLVFNRRRELADRIAAALPGVHRLLLHKYHVDEIYDATVVQPIRIASQDGLWKGVDAGFIDRVVNGVGEMVGGSSRALRRLQTGSVRAYAASLIVGVVFILGYYLWK